MKLIRELLPPRAGAFWRQLQLVGACVGTFAIGYAAISGAAYYFEYLAGSSSSEHAERAEHVVDCCEALSPNQHMPNDNAMELCILALLAEHR